LLLSGSLIKVTI